MLNDYFMNDNRYVVQWVLTVGRIMRLTLS